jgi:hypothetical protein
MPFERKFAEANSAKRKLAQVGATATAAATPVMHPRHKNVEIQSGSLRAFDSLFVVGALLLFDSALGVL